MYYVHGEKCIKCDILEDAVYTFLAMDGYNQGYKSIGIEYEANGLPCACDVIVMYGGKEVLLSNDYRCIFILFALGLQFCNSNELIFP